MSWLDTTTPTKDGCDVIWLRSSGSSDNIDCGKVLESRVGIGLSCLDCSTLFLGFCTRQMHCTHGIERCMHSKHAKITYHDMS
jgi:hypothetical protein